MPTAAPVTPALAPIALACALTARADAPIALTALATAPIGKAHAPRQAAAPREAPERRADHAPTRARAPTQARARRVVEAPAGGVVARRAATTAPPARGLARRASPPTRTAEIARP